MTRFALGGKCGRPASPPIAGVGAVEGVLASANSLRNKYASAAVPIPAAVRPNSARRVMWRRLSVSGFTAASLLRQRLIQIENLQAQRRPGGVLRWVEFLAALGFANRQQLHRRI